jgi:hypothetical protein
MSLWLTAQRMKWFRPRRPRQPLTPLRGPTVPRRPQCGPPAPHPCLHPSVPALLRLWWPKRLRGLAGHWEEHWRPLTRLVACIPPPPFHPPTRTHTALPHPQLDSGRPRVSDAPLCSSLPDSGHCGQAGVWKRGRGGYWHDSPSWRLSFPTRNRSPRHPPFGREIGATLGLQGVQRPSTAGYRAQRCTSTPRLVPLSFRVLAGGEWRR